MRVVRSSPLPRMAKTTAEKAAAAEKAAEAEKAAAAERTPAGASTGNCVSQALLV